MTSSFDIVGFDVFMKLFNLYVFVKQEIDEYNLVISTGLNIKE